ncbi:MAG: hypothetical protein KAT68_19325 [Bacteroidales bacterium]|nr:hypothetical protein [Bacteroidales bacterium]
MYIHYTIKIINKDNLVYGNNEQIINKSIKDKELLKLFGKVQILGEKQKETIKDLMSAFILNLSLAIRTK